MLVNKHFLVTLKNIKQKKHGSQWDPEPILDFWGPYSKHCLRNSTQPYAKYVSSVAHYGFNSFCSHVTRFELFLRREGDSTTLQ